MATTGISPQRKANPQGPMTLLSGAICEWFLIFLLFVDATFSYILRRFAEYCELPTPCIFCSRIDTPSGKRKFEYYNALLCRSHREEISSLVSCHAHGKLTDLREMCEECFMPMYDKLNSGSYIVGKLGTDIEKHSVQSLILHKKISPDSTGPRTCPCCNRSWGAKLNAQTFLKLTPVGLGASKANVKPPLPRVPGRSRFSRRNSFKKLPGRSPTPAIPQSEGKSPSNALPHVGYTELKFTSDSESETNFSDEEERVITVQGRNDENREHASHYVARTLLESQTDDAVLEKHSNQNFADVTSLLDQHMQLEAHKPLPTHGLEELNWEKPHHHIDSSVMPAELIPLKNTPYSDDKNHETMKSHDEDDITVARQPIKSTVFSDVGVPYILNEVSSTNSSAMTVEGKEVSTTSVEQHAASVSTKFEDIKSVIHESAPEQDDSRNVGESSSDFNHVKDLASLETQDSSLKLAERPSASTTLEDIKSVIQDSVPEQNDSQNVGESSSDFNHVKVLASLETKDSSLKLAERVTLPSASTKFEDNKSVIQDSIPEQDDAKNVGESIQDSIPKQDDAKNVGESSPNFNQMKDLASPETKDSSLKLAEKVSLSSGSTKLEDIKSVIQDSPPEQDDFQNVSESSSDFNHVKVLASLERNDSSLKLAERVTLPSASTKLEDIKSVIEHSPPEQDGSQNVGGSSSDFNHVKVLAVLERNNSSLKLAERVSLSSGPTKLEDNISDIQHSPPKQDESHNVGESSSDFNHVKVLAVLERNNSSLKLAERVSLSSGSTKLKDNKPVIQHSAPEQDTIQNMDDFRSDENHVQALPSLERNDSNLKFSERVSICDLEGESSIDILKSQIEYDRKCMNDLYKELEEERNASTIAANQAMAMITRLQEEKAQLHMEALQYLRMMDEQAEYDMEALQKANDDLTEKEKELQDLEYELESYRNNIHGGAPVSDPHKESISTMAENTIEDSCESSKMSMADEVSGNAKSLSNLDEEKLYLVEYLKQLESRIYDVSCTMPSAGLNNSGHQNPLTHDQVENVKEADGLNMQNGFSVEYGTSSIDSPSQLLENRDACCEDTNNNSSNLQNLSTSGGEPNTATLESETANSKERLKAFEGDLKFIKHSLRALHSGNDGLEYIQQMIDQLQELRNMEFKKRCLSIP